MIKPLNLLIVSALAFLLTACEVKQKASVLPEHAETGPLKNVKYGEVISQSFDAPFLTMSYGSDPLQYGQLWLPSSGGHEEIPPLIIFIHGGCWLNVYDIKHSYPLTSALAKQGYLVWSLEYRRTGDEGGGWPGSFNDILAGIEFVKEQSTFPIKTNQIVLIGHSAGGHLALLAGSYMDKSKLTGVVGLAPIVDLRSYSNGVNSCQQAGQQFMGGSSDELSGQYKKANPILRTLHPKSLLLHGDADTIVPVTQTTESSIAQFVMPGVGHFDWIHPQSEAFALLVTSLKEITDE